MHESAAARDGREQLGLTMRDVQQLTGVDFTYLSRLERGIRPFSTPAGRRLLDVLFPRLADKSGSRYYRFADTRRDLAELARLVALARVADLERQITR